MKQMELDAADKIKKKPRQSATQRQSHRHAHQQESDSEEDGDDDDDDDNDGNESKESDEAREFAPTTTQRTKNNGHSSRSDPLFHTFGNQ
jgi:hypothetical protein